MQNSITVITVNFKTPSLIADCIMTFRRFYDLPYIVVDNGGCQESIEAIKTFDVTLIENERNIGHGPAINKAMAEVITPYAFLLDSDTRTDRRGFLENMLQLFEENSSLFAAGMLRHVNNNGVRAKEGTPYIHPYACMIDVDKFRQVRPFTNRGAPALHTMQDAQANGWTVASFPIEDYIWHMVAGTRGWYRGKFLPDTDERPREQWTRYNL